MRPIATQVTVDNANESGELKGYEKWRGKGEKE